MKRHFLWILVIYGLTIMALLTACPDPQTPHSLADNRLDPNTHPTFQQIELFLDPSQTTYSGEVNIDLNITQLTSSFRFHAQEMELTSIILTHKLDTIPVTTTLGLENVVVANTQIKLSPGEYHLRISFQKDFNQQTVGLYRVAYEDNHYLFTMLEAVDARRAFPCWDEPQYKIPWQLTLNVPNDQVAVSNTPIASIKTTDSGQQIAFKQTHPLPSYLIGIAVGPFERLPLENLSVPGHIYFVKGSSHLATLAASSAAPLMEALESYLKIPYPYEKLDFIAAPEFWPGGMENAAMITFADRIVLLDPEKTSLNQKRRLAAVVAHEIAHQWLGDYVTMEWWDDLWLNESFADWMDDKIVRQIYPEYRSDLNAIRNLQTLMDRDAKITTTPIQKKITTSSQIFEDLGMAYGKGTQILNMVEQWVGAENFHEGVYSYLQANAWANATSTDLWEHLSHVSGQDVNAVLSSYVTQSSLPFLRFEMVNPKKLRITQERFVNDGVIAPDQHWVLPVDLSYKGASGEHFQTVLLDKDRMDLSFEEAVEWIIPNRAARGYYRWIIPMEMFHQISLDPGSYLNTVERIAFLGNAEALLKAGLLAGDTYLELLNSFASDSEAEVVETVLDNLNPISEIFPSDAPNPDYAVYLQNSLKPAFLRLGLEPQENESDMLTALRVRLMNWLAGPGQDEAIKGYMDSLASEYVRNSESVHFAFVGDALALSAREGDLNLFIEYMTRFEKATSSDERYDFLRALGNFRNPELQDRALAFSINGPLRTNELSAISNAIRGSEAGKDKVLAWAMENYFSLTSRMPAHRATAFLGNCADGSSLQRVERARDFINKSENIAPGSRAYLEKIEEGVLDRQRLRNRVTESMEVYLRGQAP